MISIKVDVEKALAGLRQVRDDQIPYVLSRAINSCAYLSREAMLQRIAGTYKFRTGIGWLRGGGTAGKGWIFYTPATKYKPVAVVSSDPQYTYLYLYEESGLSGVKHALHGYLAVPLGSMQQRKIPDNMRPKPLIDSGQGFIVELGKHKFIATRPVKQGRRRGLKATAGRLAGLQLLYVLMPLVKVQGQKILSLEQTVRATVEREFYAAFQREMAAAIK